MDCQIRKRTHKDAAAIYRLIQELAVFEKEPDAVEISIKDIENDGFGKNRWFEVFIAEADGEVVGMALYYKRYSTWKGRSMHLEDLIVSQHYRGKGIGKALYTKVIETAYKNDINRLEWEVLDWNKSAIAFYHNSGAEMLKNWNLCQMTKEGMKTYLESNAGI